jgi:isopenicillin N synthase-like dioxygenase
MQQVDPDHPRWGTAIFGPNQWPDSLPSKFRIDLESYYGSMECLARQLVQRLAVALGYSFETFNEFFLDPTVFLRLLRYPIYENNTPAGTYGSAPHTDHGFLTLVAQDMNGGLEVCSPDKGWLSVTPIPGTFVLNVADMLSLASGGRWPSTPHRVVLSNSERYSVAFFFDPSFDTTMQPLGSLNKSIENKQSIHYGTYLMNRFDENYDYRS